MKDLVSLCSTFAPAVTSTVPSKYTNCRKHFLQSYERTTYMVEVTAVQSLGPTYTLCMRVMIILVFLDGLVARSIEPQNRNRVCDNHSTLF